jgi:hypothetical protein
VLHVRVSARELLAYPSPSSDATSTQNQAVMQPSTFSSSLETGLSARLFVLRDHSGPLTVPPESRKQGLQGGREGEGGRGTLLEQSKFRAGEGWWVGMGMLGWRLG